ncbi:MAG: proline-rich domain-containing protein [Isosphaeraceae bacterium]
MADHYRTVDGIRAYLLSGDTSFQEPLRGLAADYARACTEANERLAKCARLLSQGLRAEAIHQAEAPPNLLDTLAALDFVERPAWAEAVARFDLAKPPDLDLKSAEFLDGAYADQDPLDNLLKRHRRLALARGPLAERIQVLREIARLDKANTIWPQDVLAYEQARLKQIPAEANDATRRFDAAALQALEQELASPNWSSKPPAGLAQGVRKALDGIRQVAARRELESLEAPLHDACAAHDLARARSIRERWRAASEFARLEPGHPLLERAEGDLAWIDQEDRREADQARYDGAVAAIREGLDARARRPDLERLHDDLIACGRDVPPDLEKSYLDRIADLKLGERRKQAILMVAGAAAAVMLGAISIVIYLEQARSARALAVAESLQKAVDSGRIDEVESLLAGYERDEPASLKGAEVIAVWPGVERLRAEEADRASRFSAKLAEIDQRPLGGRAARHRRRPEAGEDRPEPRPGRPGRRRLVWAEAGRTRPARPRDLARTEAARRGVAGPGGYPRGVGRAGGLGVGGTPGRGVETADAGLGAGQRGGPPPVVEDRAADPGPPRPGRREGPPPVGGRPVDPGGRPPADRPGRVRLGPGRAGQDLRRHPLPGRRPTGPRRRRAVELGGGPGLVEPGPAVGRHARARLARGRPAADRPAPAASRPGAEPPRPRPDRRLPGLPPGDHPPQ